LNGKKQVNRNYIPASSTRDRINAVRLFCAIFAGTLSAFSPAIASAQISLGTVVSLAQQNSTAVKLANADLRKAEAVLLQTTDVYVPNLIIGSSFGPPSIGFPAGQPSVANATMQSLAFSFPQRKYIEAARVGIQAANLGLTDAKEQVALDASVAYIELDTVFREMEAARQQSDFTNRLIQIEEQRSEAGVDPFSELLQARLTAAQLKLRALHLEARVGTLTAQLATLTGLPKSSILPDHASIPEIPAIKADEQETPTFGIESAQAQARSRQLQANGDELASKVRPLLVFGAQYNRDATSLNNYKLYYNNKFKADNFSAGFSISIPLFDLNHRAKARETAAEALRSTVEAEEARHQNDVQIASLTGSLRELDTLAEIATLKQQISAEQLKAVETQLENGNGAGSEPGATPQLSPKAEQLARIDERQKSIDSLDTGFDLNKARLSLLRALGHMQDWLHELQSKEPATATK
jgi:outer membrane protein TolC